MDVSLLESGAGTHCREIMSGLPEWFDEPEAIEACGRIVDDLPTLICQVDGEAAGVLALKRHPPETIEIFVIAVCRTFHRQGLGQRLIDEAEGFARATDCRLLTVKTLAPRGREEPQYEATRAFYRRAGFIAAETFPRLWHEDHPCLFMVKPLDRPSARDLDRFEALTRATAA